MPTLVELATQIVTAQATSSSMSTEEILNSLGSIHGKLKQMENGVMQEETPPAAEQEEKVPTLSMKEAFKKNEVVCMVCGKGGFKTLARHLSVSHQMKPGAYKKQFGIPSKQSLASKTYSDSRRKMALDRDLGGNLAKARAARVVKAQEAPAAKTTKVAKPAKAAKPAKKSPAKAAKAMA